MTPELSRALLLERFGGPVIREWRPERTTNDVPIAQELDWLKYEQTEATIHHLRSAAA